MKGIGLVVVIGLASCTEQPEVQPVPVAPTVTYLTPTEHLVRVAMTLTNRRPSLADLQRVAADPEALPEIVDNYLASPAFGMVMRDLHAENLLTRVDAGWKAIDAMAGKTVAEMLPARDEPLNLIEYVIMHDRPYSEIVTADYAIWDPLVATIFGLERLSPTSDKGRYVASTYPLNPANQPRPMAGILSSTALWARHGSAGANYHRRRANLIANQLLCFDFLHSDVDLDTSIDLADPMVVANALRANPSCAACHQTLDPLASALFGFAPGARYVSYPIPMFNTDWVDDWSITTTRPPSYFGLAAPDLPSVAARIAEDPRFPRCAAKRFAAYFTQTDRSALSFEWVNRLASELEASGQNAKALARAIVLSDEFRVSHVTPEATPEAAEALHGMLRTRPEQLATMFEDLAGFSWASTSTQPLGGVPYGRADLLRSDFLGFRSLGGGIDGYAITRPVHTTNAVSSLVLRTFAATAAGHVVESDFSAFAQPKLLLHVTVDDRDPAVIRAQLAELHARVWGALDAPDSAEVGLTYGVFEAALAGNPDVKHAWKVTLTAMFSDLRVAFY